MRALWIGAVVLIAGLALIASQARSSDPAPAPAPAPGGPPAPAPAARAAPAHRDRPSVTPGPAPVERRVPDLASARAPRTTEELRATLAAQEQERHALRQRIDRRLRDERRDEDWARQQEAQVKASVAGLASGAARVAQLECRATLCALVLEHPNSTVQSDAMTALAGTPGFRLPGKAHLEQGEGGGATTYVYLSRTGAYFPVL